MWGLLWDSHMIRKEYCYSLNLPCKLMDIYYHIILLDGQGTEALRGLNIMVKAMPGYIGKERLPGQW